VQSRIDIRSGQNDHVSLFGRHLLRKQRGERRRSAWLDDEAVAFPGESDRLPDFVLAH
jgi:hypothetical protein